MKEENSIGFIIKTIIIIIVVAIAMPVLTEYVIFRNHFYSAVENKDWASFLGSYLGGVIGGLGTLIAVLITTKETRMIQNIDRKKEIEPIVDLNMSEGMLIEFGKIDNELVLTKEIELNLEIFNLSKYPAKNVEIKIEIIWDKVFSNLEKKGIYLQVMPNSSYHLVTLVHNKHTYMAHMFNNEKYERRERFRYVFQDKNVVIDFPGELILTRELILGIINQYVEMNISKLTNSVPVWCPKEKFLELKIQLSYNDIETTTVYSKKYIIEISIDSISFANFLNQPNGKGKIDILFWYKIKDIQSEEY